MSNKNGGKQSGQQEQALATTGGGSEAFSLVPKTMEEAMKFAKLIADSDLVPNDYKGKPGNVLIATQLGREVGLHPLQACQSIAPINGRPCIFGDAMIALVRASGKLESFKETLDESTMTATCTLKRKGEPDICVSTFSKTDAQTAKLWTKQGPWTQHPKRMLKMRARAFALRDTFADVLKGLSMVEEAIDITPVVDARSTSEPLKPPQRVKPNGDDTETERLGDTSEAAAAGEENGNTKAPGDSVIEPTISRKEQIALFALTTDKLVSNDYLKRLIKGFDFPAITIDGKPTRPGSSWAIPLNRLEEIRCIVGLGADAVEAKAEDLEQVKSEAPHDA